MNNILCTIDWGYVIPGGGKAGGRRNAWNRSPGPQGQPPAKVYWIPKGREQNH